MERLSAAARQDHLPLPALAEALPSPNGHLSPEPDAAPVYHTGLGPLSFEQLYEKTSRTVGYVMREKLGMRNPEDVDDCMQAGYLKVWQKLDTEPDWLADKPKRYIVQAIVFRSKAQRFSHQRHYRKLVYDARAPVGSAQPQVTTARLEVWMDIAQALAHTAQALEEDPLMLLSLYTFITQAKATEVSQAFGVNYKTLAKRRPHTRDLLAQELAEYRPAGVVLKANGRQPASEKRACRPAPVAPWLLDDKPALWPDAELPPELQAIQADPRYLTGWGGPLSLEQILRDPQLRRAAFAKAGRLGLKREDQQDCVQRGSIKLWQSLQENPGLLADKGPVWAGTYVAYRGNPKAFHRHKARQQVFSDPDFEWQDCR